MSGGGFPPVHLPFTGNASTVRHLKVIEIPAKDDVVRVEVGLFDLLPEWGFVIRGVWSVDFDYS
jgi:hypothetical protein